MSGEVRRLTYLGAGVYAYESEDKLYIHHVHEGTALALSRSQQAALRKLFNEEEYGNPD